MKEKIKIIALSVGILVGGLLYVPAVDALDPVTVSGFASIDYSNASQLSVCVEQIGGAGRTCSPVSGDGSYSIQLSSTHQNLINLEGRLDGSSFGSSSDFISTDVRIDYPGSTGTLNLQLQTQEVSTAPIKDQFGNIVTNAPAGIVDSNNQSSYISNVNVSNNTVGAYALLGSSNTAAYASGATTTDSQGVAKFRTAKFNNFTISAQGPVGTNLNNAIGFCEVSGPTYPSCELIVKYPSWGISVPGVNTGFYANWTNGLVKLDWAAYPWATVDHYDVYRSDAQMNRFATLVATVGGLSYTYPNYLAEGGYAHDLIAYDQSGNILAVTSPQNSGIYERVDMTSPVVSGLSMSKTSITKRTGNVTITLNSVIDNMSLNGAEYYVDIDPGNGSGTPMSANTTGGFSVTTSSLSNLPVGTHTLYVRASDMAFNWSNILSINFTVK